MTSAWLALMTGNTRLHWGFFEQGTLKGVWHTAHLTLGAADQLKTGGFRADAWQALQESKNNAFSLSFNLDRGILPEQAIPLSSLWVAPVVPKQAALWDAAWDAANVVVRSHIPLSGLYPTIGIDRAINVLGAGSTLGWPVLVIDGGTALTFTAGVQQVEGNAIAGGAILPGVNLQRNALAQQTAALGDALPKSVFDQSMPKPWAMPERWATDTAGAIASGILYGMTATIADYITDWWQRFPAGHVVLTGGDGPLLHALLQQRTPAMAARVRVDSYVMFWGMRAYCKG